jgi:electron transport complex protein RnfC
VGTKIRDLLDACDGLTEDAREVVFGGPMMGAAQANLDAPIIKGTTGVVVLTDADCKPVHTWPCIRCGHCLDSCPVFLNPQRLASLATAERYEEMVTEEHLADCMLCGCCSYVCPSNLPLPQLFALAKAAARKRQAAA